MSESNIFILDNIRSLFNTSTDQELADIIGVGIHTLRGWKRSGKVNATEIVNFALEKGLDLNEIFNKEKTITQSFSGSNNNNTGFDFSSNKSSNINSIAEDFDEVAYAAFKKAHTQAIQNDNIEDLISCLVKFCKENA